MALRSFSFGSSMGVDEIPQKVLSLFSSYVGADKQLQNASEIVFAGIQGRINLDGKFNMEGYTHAIEHNKKLYKNNRKKKESFIDYGSPSDDYNTIAQEGGIQADRLQIEEVKDAFEELIEHDELRYAVSAIKQVNAEFIVVEELDLIDAIRMALKGIPQAIKDVQRICDFYPQVAENVKTILSSGFEFEEVFALA